MRLMIDRKAAERGLLVFMRHVAAGLSHRDDDRIEAHAMGAVATQGERSRVDRLHGAEGVALDTGDLHEAADGIAGEAEVVLHSYLCGLEALLYGAAERLGEGCGGHG